MNESNAHTMKPTLTLAEVIIQTIAWSLGTFNIGAFRKRIVVSACGVGSMTYLSFAPTNQVELS
jgi:hypothetical protein